MDLYKLGEKIMDWGFDIAIIYTSLISMIYLTALIIFPTDLYHIILISNIFLPLLPIGLCIFIIAKIISLIILTIVKTIHKDDK